MEPFITRDYEGDFDSRSLCFRFIFLLIPVITDFILTIISFDKNLKGYYILRIVCQFIYIFLCLSSACFSSYTNAYGIDGMPVFFFYIGMGIITLGVEISSLILFIKDFNKIMQLGKISYYIHWILYPCLLFCGLINIVCKE